MMRPQEDVRWRKLAQPRLGFLRPENVAMSSPVSEAVIDVREIEPQLRHPVIFGVFARLQRGESFEIVNDHDPKPLLRHFGMNFPGAFDWTYRESGPDVWRVRIGRV